MNAGSDRFFVVDELPQEVLAVLWMCDRSPGTRLPDAAIAGAVMERGDLRAMRWLMRVFGVQHLRHLLPLVVRRLSPRTLALWRCVLDIDLPEPPRVPWVSA